MSFGLAQNRRMPEAGGASGPPRRRLFRKYVAMFIGLVSLVLMLNGGLDFWFSYRQNRTALALIQQEKAEAVGQRITNFFDMIKGQLSWTTHAGWATDPVELRRRDYARLLRQVPAIIELIQLDAEGKEQLKVSRSATDVVGSAADYSREPSFTEALAHRTWFGSVHLCKDSEPCITVAIAASDRIAGVTVAEVNLKSIWDMIAALKIGEDGYAYLLDRDGRLIAHPKIGPVLGNTELAMPPQVATATAKVPIASIADGHSAPAEAMLEKGINGQSVLSVHAAINPVGWLIFVEVPLKEALGPLYSSGVRTGVLLAFGLALAALAALLLARRMVVPIRVMQNGAARFGAGELDQRIEIHTGDELEGLADEFNRMAGDLQKSYSNLEMKVEERTAELTEALDVIAASISYASRIQRAMLPEPQLFKTILPDYFILWEPRDVVSGDVYWLMRWGEGVLIALGDCTGHGVPGAFVTLIASAALERAQLDVDPGAVGKLISRMNQLIKSTLKQAERRGESDDGMDLALCYVSADHTRLTFAGAGISLFSAAPGEDLVETKGDKRGVGYRRIPFGQTYAETDLPVVPGTRFYMTSDGLIDQIGGERHRAFGLARLLSLLDRHQDQPMVDQKNLLVAALSDYQGREIRRDDVLVLGFRLNGSLASSRISLD